MGGTTENQRGLRAGIDTPNQNHGTPALSAGFPAYVPKTTAASTRSSTIGIGCISRRTVLIYVYS